MSKRKEIVSQVWVYLVGTILSQGLTLAAAVLTRRFLGPVQMGVWALLQVVLKYSSYTTLGTTAAVSREIPFHAGRQDRERVERIQDTYFTYGVLSSMVLAALLALGAALLRGRLDPVIVWGLVWTGALLVLQRFNNVLITLLRAHKQFEIASKQMVVSSVVNAVCITVLSYRFEVYGYIWGMGLSYLFNTLYILWAARPRLRWGWDAAEFRGLAGYGAPLLAIGLMNTAFMSIDRFMIAGMLGLREVGLYGMAAMAASYAANAPNAVSVVLLPRFHEKYGREGRAQDLRGYTARSAEVFADLMPFLIGAGWCFAPWGVARLLPDFTPGVAALKLLVVGSYFLAVTHPYNTFLIAIKRHWALVPLLAALCLAALAVNAWVLRSGYGIEGVAIAAAVVLAMRFVSHLALAARYSGQGAGMGRECLLIALKFAVMTALLWALDSWVPLSRSTLAGASLRYAILCAVYTPVLVRFVREYGLWEAIRRKAGSARAGA
ncbi:MAG: hypothetical protein MOGMAGMI_00850 [Candidatus Omnitrophica bacterium]|nr:hypothetical protein [Candidatus Omnitrophota bacterium]